MNDLERHVKNAVEYLLDVQKREGLEGALTAAHAVVIAGTAISQHELRKACRRAFPDAPEMPEGGPFTMCANGEKIAVYRELINGQHWPSAA